MIDLSNDAFFDYVVKKHSMLPDRLVVRKNNSTGVEFFLGAYTDEACQEGMEVESKAYIEGHYQGLPYRITIFGPKTV